MRPHPITAYQSKSKCCQAMGQLSEQITLSYFVTNNAQKGQMGFLPDQRLLVIKEFSRGTDDINYCCEHNILVTNYKQSRKMISGGWVLCPTSVSQSSCRAPSSLLPSLTQHLNSQLCYFCQVWSDCLCLLRSCLLQSLSRPSRWPCLQKDSSDNRSAGSIDHSFPVRPQCYLPTSPCCCEDFCVYSSC